MGLLTLMVLTKGALFQSGITSWYTKVSGRLRKPKYVTKALIKYVNHKEILKHHVFKIQN